MVPIPLTKRLSEKVIDLNRYGMNQLAWRLLEQLEGDLWIPLSRPLRFTHIEWLYSELKEHYAED